MANVNEGHRSRLRQRMMTEGLQSFQDHEVLEMLLFQYLPRKDTNKIAHSLLNKFGNFANVMDASPEQLMTVEGISQTTACNLAVWKEVWQRYKRSAAQKNKLSTISAILDYAQQVIGESYVEKVIVVYVDHSTRYLMNEEFCSGSLDNVQMDMKKIVTSAMRCNAAGVLLFHCHVDGDCTPSEPDRVFTERLFNVLASLNIVLLEHLIFNNDENYYSFFAEKQMEKLTEKYNRNKQSD